MPSPVGHFLGGVAAGGLVAADPAQRSSSRSPVSRLPRAFIVFGLLGALPDIDFLFGTHSTYTHSVGATVLVGLVALAVLRPRSGRLALAAACAYGSHLLFDWLGNDTTPPIGIMALWPFSSAFYQSDLHWFMAISRRYWLPNFWSHNLTAVSLEVLLLGPPAAVVWWWRTRVAGRTELR